MKGSLVNVKRLKAEALRAAGELRPSAGFNRVGREFVERMDSQFARIIRREVQALPSVGKTIK